MTARTPRIVASVVLGLPSAAAIYGSAANLITIAGEQHLTDPRVLPFCLDLLAIGIVVSAVFCGHDDHLSRVTPWLAYGSSAALQVTEVWSAGPRAWAVHALPLAAAILGTETILRLWRPAPPTLPPAPTPDVVAEPAAATPTPVSSAQRRAPVRKARPRHHKPARTADVDPELVAAAHRIAADLNVAPTALTVARLATEARVHKTRAGAALRHLREQDQS